MVFTPFSSMLGEAETVVCIYKHDTRHNQHCRSNNEIVTNVYHDNNNKMIYLHRLQDSAMQLVPKLKP